ncbi:MAG: ribonuclease Z [Enterococcaceae bacterium]|jgi:ribonuclease Z|nr:ribonuclease Z [Enterococcaceae bacterium]MCI1920040.1 ribonuclease Z [Enterococcaceae bacterium]
MEIQFLGTGAGVPAKQRNVSSIALKLLEEINATWLFDCGEGTQMQILRTTIRPRKITKIFITHLHGDHIFGLPGFLSSRSFQGGDTPLDIYGPQGIKRFIQTSLETSGTRLGYLIRYHELAEDGCLFDEQGFRVEAKVLDHGMTSFGYRIHEKDHVGELQVDKLKALGIPSGPLYGQLKKGAQVELPNGEMLDGRDFLAPSIPGRILAILGDTRPTPQSVELAAGADVLVHEATFSADEAKMAKQYYHSTSLQAAEIAKKAQVSHLILTHISARYLFKDAQRLLREARKVFPLTEIANDFDLFRLDVHHKFVKLPKEGHETNER